MCEKFHDAKEHFSSCSLQREMHLKFTRKSACFMFWLWRMKFPKGQAQPWKWRVFVQ
jgi:hypothetical protein